MILYFKEDCNYSAGNKNYYRNNISFIINRENNNTLKNQETLIVHKGYGIEIHFNESVKGLERFFNPLYHNNIIFLVSIDLSNFDSSSMTYMGSMFYECSSLESINLTNFNTSLVTRMDYMFYRCYSLKSINLSSFNTSLVTHMDHMFHDCSSLESIELSSNKTITIYIWMIDTSRKTTSRWFRRIISWEMDI